MIQRHTGSRWWAFLVETQPLRNKDLRGLEQVGHANPGDEGQFMQRRTWSVESDGGYITLERAIATLALAVFGRFGLGREFLGRKELMTGHADFPSLRLPHEPHPATEMQRHCHKQGEHDLER